MTGIEWTDETWNPIVGCSIISAGCTNCYAMRQAARVEKMAKANYEAWREKVQTVALPEGSSIQPFSHHYQGLTRGSNAGPVWTGKVALAPDHIFTAPLRWRKPCRIFVNSMGDLFHESVPDEWIDKVFAVMALCPQHTFQVLTKRSRRMREYMQPETGIFGRVINQAEKIRDATRAPATRYDYDFPNVWLGVSCENQATADERIPDLLGTPAAVRFVSAEPLLGPVDFTWHGVSDDVCDDRIKWIIVGGESGSGARPMDPAWARSIRDQCKAAGVPFFMKQMGGPSKSRMPPIPEDLMIREFPG